MEGMHRRLMFTALFHGVFSMVSVYYVTVLNSLEPLVKHFANESIVAHYGYHMDSGQIALVWAITSASFMLGATVGPFPVKFFAERYGRKNTVMIYNNVLLIFTGALMWSAVKFLNSIELFIFGRFLSGFSLPGHGLQAHFFLSALRLKLGASYPWSLLSVGSRIWLIAALAGALPQIGGTLDIWPYLMLFPVVPCAIHLSLFWYFPRSPKYLYITKGKKVESSVSLSFYHGQSADIPKIHADYDKERALQRRASEMTIGIKEILLDRQYRIPFLLCVGVVLTPSLAGGDLALNYSTGIMLKLGIENAALVSLLLVHLPSVFVTTIAVLVTDKIGRRVNLLVGFALGLTAVGVLFGCAFSTQYFYPESTSTLTVASVVSIMAIICGHSFGPAFIHAIMPGELCPQSMRSTVWSYSMTFGFVSKVIFLLWFPPVEALVGSYALLPSFLIGWIMWVILFKFLPETKGKTVEETHRAAGWTEGKSHIKLIGKADQGVSV